MLQGWGHAPRRTLYETLIVFVVYFVLKMFKNIDFFIKTRCTEVYFLPEQECNLITVLE